MRTFYRWAVRTGRLEQDMTAEPSLRAEVRRVSPAWEAELLPFSRYLRALGRNERSIRVMVSRVRRIARDLGDRPPYEVSRARNEAGRSGGCTRLRSDGAGRRLVAARARQGCNGAYPCPTTSPARCGRAGPGYVFLEQEDGHISVLYLGKRIGDLLPPGVTMHKLRHRFATRTYDVDHDVFTVQKLLGHASPATTERYVRIHDDRGRRLVEHAARIG